MENREKIRRRRAKEMFETRSLLKPQFGENHILLRCPAENFREEERKGEQPLLTIGDDGAFGGFLKNDESDVRNVNGAP